MQLFVPNRSRRCSKSWGSYFHCNQGTLRICAPRSRRYKGNSRTMDGTRTGKEWTWLTYHWMYARYVVTSKNNTMVIDFKLRRYISHNNAKLTLIGRVMYVIPFSMGPVGGALSKIGVQLTDSNYVVLSMRVMTRLSSTIWPVLAKTEDYVRCFHSIGAPRPVQR